MLRGGCNASGLGMAAEKANRLEHVVRAFWTCYLLES
jgi:hypothetical protein